ncbi:hypothetical protein LAZ67_1007786 [Cordylochernes scorpioides]|uniref:Ig-like domain-containing protein n=1 Tax=Cordylochernes scorpioides TaxID=51811 RepID=A0ABY6JZI6_9ARAC|nr:hypothetical protein LAZ67_1007786 [Cordylochernes scorpioides]
MRPIYRYLYQLRVLEIYLNWFYLLEPPQIQPFGFPKDLKPGDKTPLMCAVVKGQPPFTFTWQKNGVMLDTKSVTNVRIVNNDMFSTMFFDPVDSSSGGNYTCEVKNRQGRDSHTATLTIQAPPEWIQPTLSDTTALEGGSVTLTCRAKGFPEPTVRWSRVDDSQRDLGNSSVLVFNPVERVHAGKYRCTADNGLGPPLQHTVTLTVHCEYAILITAPPHSSGIVPWILSLFGEVQ